MSSTPLRPTHVLVALGSLATAAAQIPPGESPMLTAPRITQPMITAGQLRFDEIRDHGLRIFASPFNKFDGMGDGPMNRPGDTTSPGGRPTLQNNGMFLRINGLDAQTCVECHSFLSTTTVPFEFAIGGHGGANNNAMFKPRSIDVADTQGNAFASFDGRFINPPFLFGAGGVELVAKEMTMELQKLAALAQLRPGVPVRLVAKGVDFGTVVWRNGALDTSGVQGIEHDLVVRPFGRKGEFPTTRAFDLDALPFHFGMQPVEAVGAGIDDDGDGVVDEILVGELSALAIFTTTLPPPRQAEGDRAARQGRHVFERVGCTQCHVPELETETSYLTYSFPEVPTDPSANVYYAVDLRKTVGFEKARRGGVRVPMFSDLKRHDMGRELAESTGGVLDPFFVTARLWGIGDTAPYLHDGRATTLTDAILMHGGEALAVRNAFAALPASERSALLTFLRSLRTPRAQDLR